MIYQYNVINPYTNEIVDRAPVTAPVEIDRLLERSYSYKCCLSSKERATVLRNTAKAVEIQKNDLAVLITKESGLCIKQSLYEVDRAINSLSQSATQAESLDEQDISSEFISHYTPTTPKLTVITEPWDLAVAITPFNHPLNMVVHKIGPSIAAGTPVVLKPSEKTPLTAMALRRILLAESLPPDMVNIITGTPPKPIVDQMVTFPKLDVVTFTGSVDTGKYIAKKMATHGNELKKYIPELGGNCAFVVLDDADVELAAKIALSAFDNAGQRCTSINRIMVQNGIANEFIEKFAALTDNVKYGDPMDPDVDMGCLVTEESAALIQERVANAVMRGGKLIRGNIRRGALYSPTIIDMVEPSTELVVKETFGPVAPIIRITDVDDAIGIVNAGRFRLAGAIATKNMENAIKYHNSIRVGQFSWNGPPGYRTEEAPFGGFGDSGNGEKEGIIMSVRAMRRIRTFYEH
ncbi:phosphonoacetaldehyde dehydrogenase [Candidatus Omnitrophus magneticus]|uniref:Phosphonoacetaldehyde dehydrogenase n=1 Tax=Candidatus Omnitrophus magneticus TaxID=1609969 RepID=A0A0F0CPH9_9BACT|nr:phosphonoacetaldehyde dehydrogenase [Candidatus Omnitrophus magneticus]